MATLAAKSIERVYGTGSDRYLALVQAFPLRPIRTDSELDLAIAAIDELLDKKRLSLAEQDYLDVLSELVQTYESLTMPEPKISESRMLRYLMEIRELSQVQLARQAAIAESTISEVLSGKRQLNRTQIVKLATFFHVNPSVFLVESP